MRSQSIHFPSKMADDKQAELISNAEEHTDLFRQVFLFDMLLLSFFSISSSLVLDWMMYARSCVKNS